MPHLEWTSAGDAEFQEKAGLRFGDKGTHTSRTMMLAELTELLAAVPPTASRDDYATAIVDDNVLGKQTASNRRLTNQRLGELYGLDRTIPIFRVLRRLWDIDESGRPQLALLCALARDPLLRSTAGVILALNVGEELQRSSLAEALTRATQGRLNESITDKVARNAGSSWTQSGHLQGRVRKVRQSIRATAGATAFAMWLGAVQGLAGDQLLTSPWARMLDATPTDLLDHTLRAKQLGLLQARKGGGVVEIDAWGVDPAGENLREQITHGTD
ncbi:MAG: hypothetical protein ABEL51_00665 [Salinibacter sp.]